MINDKSHCMLSYYMLFQYIDIRLIICIQKITTNYILPEIFENLFSKWWLLVVKGVWTVQVGMSTVWGGSKNRTGWVQTEAWILSWGGSCCVLGHAQMWTFISALGSIHCLTLFVMGGGPLGGPVSFWLWQSDSVVQGDKDSGDCPIERNKRHKPVSKGRRPHKYSLLPTPFWKCWSTCKNACGTICFSFITRWLWRITWLDIFIWPISNNPGELFETGVFLTGILFCTFLFDFPC